MVGDPEKCIGLAAREHSVDLVLVSRQSGQLQAAYGNDLAGILGRLRCPLLTIPVDAQVPVEAIDEIRASLRQAKVVTAGGSAVDEDLKGPRDFDEVPIQMTLHSRG